MRVRYTTHARNKLDAQIDYLLGIGALQPAIDLDNRVNRFVVNTLGLFPRAGRYFADLDLWETWIPRTKMIVWYRFTDDELIVVDVWHTAQDRFNQV